MHQLATESPGRGPAGLGVPREDANNGKTYVYDIDHRANTCIAVMKLYDVKDVLVSAVSYNPNKTGTLVGSVTGGPITGYDMYGQLLSETIGAASSTAGCYSRVISAPADARWLNQFGLPYKYASDPGAPAPNFSYAGPSGVNGRGVLLWQSGTDVNLDAPEVEIANNYVVDRDNMFGDVRSNFASGDRIADQTFSGTIDNTGAVAITTASVADSSSYIKITPPADAGGPIRVANGVGVVNYQLSALWMSKYAAQIGSNQTLIDDLFRGTTENGTKINIDLTGSLV